MLFRSNDTATTEIYTLSLHDALPICSLGGLVEYGRGGQTSCFLMARNQSHPDGSIWPVTIYPGGKCEVVFQHMTNRKPFDDPGLREELRQRLSKVPGVVLPEAKLELRPGFELSVLSDPTAREVFLEHLTWFFHRANPA